MVSINTDMDEKKLNEALLPALKGQTITIPNDVQQLTIKDSTVFIGNNRSRRPISTCFQRLNGLTLLVFILVAAIIILPTVYRLTRTISISGTADSGYYLSFNRNTPNPLTAAINNADRLAALPFNILDQNELNSATGTLNGAILFSSRDPSSGLSEMFKFTTIYTARGNRTTISFYIQNNPGSTYLDDVSVKANDRYELIDNGDFENDTHGWQGLYSIGYNYRSTYAYSYSKCAVNKYTTNNIVSQTFNTTPGTILNINFKLRWDSIGQGVSTKVIIYP